MLLRKSRNSIELRKSLAREKLSNFSQRNSADLNNVASVSPWLRHYPWRFAALSFVLGVKAGRTYSQYSKRQLDPDLNPELSDSPNEDKRSSSVRARSSKTGRLASAAVNRASNFFVASLRTALISAAASYLGGSGADASELEPELPVE